LKGYISLIEAFLENKFPFEFSKIKLDDDQIEHVIKSTLFICIAEQKFESQYINSQLISSLKEEESITQAYIDRLATGEVIENKLNHPFALLIGILKRAYNNNNTDTVTNGTIMALIMSLWASSRYYERPSEKTSEQTEGANA
jgi:hypothetical protein